MPGSPSRAAGAMRLASTSCRCASIACSRPASPARTSPGPSLPRPSHASCRAHPSGDPSSSRATRSSSITCCSIAPPPSPTCRGCATRSRAGSSRPPSIRAARRRSWCDGCLLPRAGHVEDARAGVPEADALDRADDRRPEAPELEGGLVLDVEEGAHVAEVAVQALRPRQEVVVGLDTEHLEARAREEAVHLGAGVAELGEAEPLAAELPEHVEGAQRRIHDQAAEGVVVGHDHEEEPARLEHAVDLAEERLGPVLEVL